jgi:hypothetical protein
VKKLGPRELQIETSTGECVPLSISIEFALPREIDLGDGVTIEECVGSVAIESQLFSKVMWAPGSDEIEVVFQLMRLADAYLKKSCADVGAKLFTTVRGDSDGPMGMFG